MSKTVLELQSDCLNEDVSVTSIIRKAYAIGKKLSLEGFVEWAKNELDGYPADFKTFPKFRIVRVDYKAFNPYNGWIPVIITEQHDISFILSQNVHQSVEEIEALVKKADGSVSFRVNPELEKYLNSGGPGYFETHGFIGRSALVAILKSVRNIVLDWTLELEKNGVLGENLSFNPEEKSKASEGLVNFGTIVYGSVSDSQLVGKARDVSISNAEGLDVSAVKALVNQILASYKSANLPTESVSIVEESIKELTDELKNEKPDTNKVRGFLGSLKAVFENVVGNVIASGIVYEIAKYLPH